MSYDKSCYELAKSFLEDQGWNNTLDMDRLAQEIQDTIEDYIADLNIQDNEAIAEQNDDK